GGGQGGGPGGGGGGGGGAGGGGGGGGNKPKNRFLPGVRGKDFWIGRHGGNQYAIYTAEFRGNKVRVAVRLPSSRSKLRAMGLKPGDGRHITKAQAKGIQFGGFAADELIIHGEERNPFKAIIRALTRNFAGTDVLEDDEVAAIMLMGAALGWSDGEIQGELRNSKWWKKSTRYSRQWAQETTPEERKRTIASYQQKMVDALEETYGLGWLRHVPGGMKDIRQEAQRIASGQYGLMGDPNDAFNLWIGKQTDRARKIEGTPAWVAFKQDQIAQREFENRPEEAFFQLQDMAKAYLGYDPRGGARMAQDQLKELADDLAFARKTQGEIEQMFGRKARDLYQWLGPDERWIDRASTYKSIAEGLLGTPLGWNDSFLQDFTARDAEGNVRDPKIAMTADQFAHMVRSSDRWRFSTQGQETGLQGAGILTSMFAGAA
ncbi:MAG: hypothetical protein ACRDKV_00665, partial [Solirubrobacterales bacterium]